MTEKQRRFVEAYVGPANGNATEAARQAGYKCPDPEGRRLLRKATMRDAVSERLSEAAAAGDIPDATEVLQRLGEHARASIEDFIDIIPGTGTAVLNLERAAAAGKLRVVRELIPSKRGYTLKLHDSQAALTTLGKYHQLFIERVHLTFEQLAPVVTVLDGIIREVCGATQADEVHRRYDEWLAEQTGGGR